MQEKKNNYLRRRLASEGSVTLDVTLSRCVCVRHIGLGGEGNALYPVLSSLVFYQSLFDRRALAYFSRPPCIFFGLFSSVAKLTCQLVNVVHFVIVIVVVVAAAAAAATKMTLS